jgi:hypothetical protein
MKTPSTKNSTQLAVMALLTLLKVTQLKEKCMAA